MKIILKISTIFALLNGSNFVWSIGNICNISTEQSNSNLEQTGCSALVDGRWSISLLSSNNIYAFHFKFLYSGEQIEHRNVGSYQIWIQSQNESKVACNGSIKQPVPKTEVSLDSLVINEISESVNCRCNVTSRSRFVGSMTCEVQRRRFRGCHRNHRAQYEPVAYINPIVWRVPGGERPRAL